MLSEMMEIEVNTLMIEKILPHNIKKIVSQYSIIKDTIGMSPTKVFKLVNNKDVLYLKVGHKRYKGTTYEVKREAEGLFWLQDKLLVPKVIQFEESDEYDFLLMSKAEGSYLSEKKNLSPKKIVEIYVESIKLVQAIDISSCPFNSDISSRLLELDYLLRNNLAAEKDFYEGNTPFSTIEELITFLKKNSPKEELVFSHGDLCDSNIFVNDKHICSLIDWGRGGKANKWYDIAFCVNNIREELGSEKFVDLFFDLLCVEPDWNKIRYFVYLDELF